MIHCTVGVIGGSSIGLRTDGAQQNSIFAPHHGQRASPLPPWIDACTLNGPQSQQKTGTIWDSVIASLDVGPSTSD